MLGGNRSESGIITLYSASEQGYLVLALYKHALLCYYNLINSYSRYIHVFFKTKIRNYKVSRLKCINLKRYLNMSMPITVLDDD